MWFTPFACGEFGPSDLWPSSSARESPVPCHRGEAGSLSYLLHYGQKSKERAKYLQGPKSHVESPGEKRELPSLLQGREASAWEGRAQERRWTQSGASLQPSQPVSVLPPTHSVQACLVLQFGSHMPHLTDRRLLQSTLPVMLPTCRPQRRKGSLAWE